MRAGIGIRVRVRTRIKVRLELGLGLSKLSLMEQNALKIAQKRLVDGAERIENSPEEAACMRRRGVRKDKGGRSR